MEIMWPLILFTFFLCFASGIFLWQGVMTILDKAQETQFVSLLASLVCYGLGGIFVLLHLASPLRIFNGFGHITSGITQEVIAMVIVVLAIIVFFLMYWRSEDRVAPKWCGVMAIITACIMIFVMAHSYWMASVPVWNNIVYILFFMANMLLVGILASGLIARICKSQSAVDFTRKMMPIFFIIYAVLLIIYAIYLVVLGNTAYSVVGHYFDPTIPDIYVTEGGSTMASIYMGAYAPLFWIGVVVVGLILPALAVFFLSKEPVAKSEAEAEAEAEAKATPKERKGIAKLFFILSPEPGVLRISNKDNRREMLYAGAGLVCALAGGICWRVILYVTAIHVFPIF